MERLTARDKYGNAYYPKCFESPCKGEGCKIEICSIDQEICEKLAAYEDTMMSPKQIEELDDCDGCITKVQEAFIRERTIKESRIIRTPEEIARYIIDKVSCDKCHYYQGCNRCGNCRNCDGKIIEWLTGKQN